MLRDIAGTRTWVRSLRRLAGSLACIFVLSACGGGSESSIHAPEQAATERELFAYDFESAYANVMPKCVKAETAEQACTLQELPILADQLGPGAEPRISDIMTRVVSSHLWMSVRFREVLEQMPTASLRLFRPVTAIVIASDIRPSYYSSGTGAIYIDPANLWLTLYEKGTVDKDEDYRSNFDRDLRFASLLRYVSGNQRAWAYYSLYDQSTRNIYNITLPMAQVLFHELAHANDFLPPAQLAALPRHLKVFEAIDVLYEGTVAERLHAEYPLTSEMMKGLAGVMYYGKRANAQQRGLTAEQVGAEFERDHANYDYAYASSHEDVAMLFEEVMLKHYFGIDSEIAYADLLSPDAFYCNEIVVRWGYRNRVGDASVRPRASFVLQHILGQSAVSGYFTRMPEPLPLTYGNDWCSVSSPRGSVNTAASGELVKPSAVPPSDFGPRHH